MEWAWMMQLFYKSWVNDLVGHGPPLSSENAILLV